MPNQEDITAVVKTGQFITLDRSLTLPNGTVLPKGSTVMCVPQTTAHAVRVPGNKSLLAAWSSLSKVGHTHPDYQSALAGFQTELTRWADRTTKLETWAAEKGYVVA